MLNKDIIYLDSAATTLKPYYLSDSISDYYNNYSANSHRADYDIGLKVDDMIDKTRLLVKDLIKAKNVNQIVFTYNTTDSINKVINSYFKYNLSSGDEVLTTKSEHASMILPWFELKKLNNININYIDLTNDYKLTLDNIKKRVTDKTKVISIAHVTNVIGDVRPIKEIIEYAHQNNIIVLIDAAQSIPHMSLNVTDLDVDFLVFSAHKMCGPTGVGMLYVNEKYLDKMNPVFVGGGMNYSFESDYSVDYNEMPYLLEAGTPNIAGIIGFGTTINYLNKIGINNIEKYVKELKKYALEKLSNVPNIIIYNKNSEGNIITFNIKDIFAQDVAIYLNKYKICVRAGSHCAKILKDELGIKNTCRISLYFYNTKEEIDKLIEVLSNPNILKESI